MGGKATEKKRSGESRRQCSTQVHLPPGLQEQLPIALDTAAKAWADTGCYGPCDQP